MNRSTGKETGAGSPGIFHLPQGSNAAGRNLRSDSMDRHYRLNNAGQSCDFNEDNRGRGFTGLVRSDQNGWW